MLQSTLCAATAMVLCVASSVGANAQQRLLTPNNAASKPLLPNNAPSDFKFKDNSRQTPSIAKPTIRNNHVEQYTFAHTPCRGWDLNCGKPEHDKQYEKIQAEQRAASRRTTAGSTYPIPNAINNRTRANAQSQQFENQIHNSRTRGYDPGAFQPCRDRYDTGCTFGDRVF